jgi:hypothetical protein
MRAPENHGFTHTFINFTVFTGILPYYGRKIVKNVLKCLQCQKSMPHAMPAWQWGIDFMTRPS